MTHQSDPLLDAKESAAEIGSSPSTFWRGVRDGRWPAPVYPSPASPRWRQSELRARLELTRKLPSEAKAERRNRRIALEAAAQQNAAP